MASCSLTPSRRPRSVAGSTIQDPSTDRAILPSCPRCQMWGCALSTFRKLLQPQLPQTLPLQHRVQLADRGGRGLLGAAHFPRLRPGVPRLLRLRLPGGVQRGLGGQGQPAGEVLRPGAPAALHLLLACHVCRLPLRQARGQPRLFCWLPERQGGPGRERGALQGPGGGELWAEARLAGSSGAWVALLPQLRGTQQGNDCYQTAPSTQNASPGSSQGGPLMSSRPIPPAEGPSTIYEQSKDEGSDGAAFGKHRRGAGQGQCTSAGPMDDLLTSSFCCDQLRGSTAGVGDSAPKTRGSMHLEIGGDSQPHKRECWSPS